MSRLISLATQGLIYALLSFAAFLSVFPFYWMLVGTTNTSSDIIKGKSNFGAALGENAAKFFSQVDAPRVFFNSTLIAVIATI